MVEHECTPSTQLPVSLRRTHFSDQRRIHRNLHCLQSSKNVFSFAGLSAGSFVRFLPSTSNQHDVFFLAQSFSIVSVRLFCSSTMRREIVIFGLHFMDVIAKTHKASVFHTRPRHLANARPAVSRLYLIRYKRSGDHDSPTSRVGRFFGSSPLPKSTSSHPSLEVNEPVGKQAHLTHKSRHFSPWQSLFPRNHRRRHLFHYQQNKLLYRQ